MAVKLTEEKKQASRQLGYIHFSLLLVVGVM